MAGAAGHTWGRAWRWLRERLDAGLPVEARWIVPSVDSRPFVCWPRPGPRDPRPKLALEVLQTLQLLARQRQLRVEGANLEMAWTNAAPGCRRVRALLHVASPEPAAHIQALGRAIVLHLRSADSAAGAGIEIDLHCQHVSDDAALLPTHFW